MGAAVGQPAAADIRQRHEAGGDLKRGRALTRRRDIGASGTAC
jgi:hypothetical protein